jgi:hypothetical protein
MLDALLDLVAPVLSALAWITAGSLAVVALALVGFVVLLALWLVRAAVHAVGDLWLRVVHRERGGRLGSTAAVHELLGRPGATDTRPLRLVA